MKKYGVGVFGIGWVAGEHIKAYMQNPHMEVKALASRRKESARAKKDELGLDCEILDDYESMLKRDDIDIIDLCTPNVLHAQETIDAAAAGKHVVIEKPIAMNIEELRAVRDAIVKAGVKSQVGFISRWNPHVGSNRPLVERVELGRQHQKGRSHGEPGCRVPRGGSALLSGRRRGRSFCIRRIRPPERLRIRTDVCRRREIQERQDRQNRLQFRE